MIAQTIINQLGGAGRLKAMVNARNFGKTADENGLVFRFSGSKLMNYIKIKLNVNDLYNIEYYKVWGVKIKTVMTEEDVYGEDLIRFISETTGLDLAL